MRVLFTLLLALFTVISAYITYLFTSSLASSTGTLIALSALGLCFDLLKCSLPSVALGFLEIRRFGYGALCGGVCVLLVAFSLYASFNLFDTATADKAKTATAYQLTLKQLEAAQAEQEKLISMNYLKVAREQVAPRIEALSAKLAALSAGSSTATAQAALIMNGILAVLLELSVLACHVALRFSSKQRSKSSANYYTVESAQTQLASGASPVLLSAQDNTASAIKTLSNSEIARILIERKESALSYRKIATKYDLSQARIADIKKIMQQEQAGTKQTPLQLVQ